MSDIGAAGLVAVRRRGATVFAPEAESAPARASLDTPAGTSIGPRGYMAAGRPANNPI